ncbi:hypothetical protein [Paenibacillus agaridevorans]|uniref:hypothetical protein n=1 Tax=Paenibacillus agaridevorans TaxID=171404 RepID=UPI000D58CE9A|nr:hypothetical protein [Paenibacillus agaridevorans]
MKKWTTVFLLAFVLVCCGSSSNVFADWNSRFVVYDGGSYTVTDAKVTEDRIGKKIGKVTHYSDREDTYRGNFSNTMPKGTAYYAIIGEDTRDTIAVQTPEGDYIAAVYDGRYAGATSWTSVYVWMGAAAVVVLAIIAAMRGANSKQKAR